MRITLDGRAGDGAQNAHPTARSPYVAPEIHPRICALFPDADIEALPDAGHWLHAEQPEAFVGKVEGWWRGV